MYSLFYIALVNGKLTNACGLGGLFNAHSRPNTTLLRFNLTISSNNRGISQGFLDAALPCTNCVYNICKNNTIEVTDIIDPKLLIIFHPVNASA